MPVSERLSQRQIETLRHLAICCGNGNLVMLTRDQREAMAPLWRRGIVEVWNRMVPDEGSRGPFYRPTERGRALTVAIFGWDKAAA